jgi:hypothetical protein
MLEVMMIVASSPFSGLITTIQNIVLPVLLFVLGILAIKEAVSGRFVSMITLIGVFILALIVFLNPGIVSGLATNAGQEIESSI